MTGWYDPSQLVQTGIRVAASTVFGRMFDRRELMASLDAFDVKDFGSHFDYSHDEELWLDYCADSGDGWNSTYAVARLLARAQLVVKPAPIASAGAAAPIEPANTPPSETLERGRVLVFGGDLVYPTASRDEYRCRLQAPFDTANLKEAGTLSLGRSDIFAIPGNHDWYDGLTAFAHLFCTRHMQRSGSAASPGRTVCGRRTHQGRSYFALKLPHNWWLCAYDVQLDGFVDQAQLSFFEYVAQNLMDPGSNVILCVGQPVWAYAQNRVPKEFKNYAFAAQVVTGTIGVVGGGETRKHNLRLVLTGDAHHYAHFTESDAAGATVHYLTCGLGGAFLHATHWLKSTQVDVEWRAPQPLNQQPTGHLPNRKRSYRRSFELGTVYPDASSSWWTTFWNLGFLAINPQFSVFMGAVGVLAAWLLHFAALVNHTTLVALLGDKSWPAAIRALFLLLIDSPWPALIITGILAALIYFNDHSNKWMRRLIGISHALAHVLIYCAILIALTGLLPSSGWGELALIVLMGVATFVTAPSIMGIYLLIGLNVFGGHWNEAFSSLRIEDHKGFLRLKIAKDGTLTIYPVVVDKVPKADDAELSPRLVEPPIVLAK